MILLGKEDSCDTFSFSVGIFVDLISRFQLGGIAFIRP